MKCDDNQPFIANEETEPSTPLQPEFSRSPKLLPSQVAMFETEVPSPSTENCPPKILHFSIVGKEQNPDSKKKKVVTRLFRSSALYLWFPQSLVQIEKDQRNSRSDHELFFFSNCGMCFFRIFFFFFFLKIKGSRTSHKKKFEIMRNKAQNNRIFPTTWMKQDSNKKPTNKIDSHFSKAM